VSGPVDIDPDVALLPLHPTVAAQVVASELDHVNVDALPLTTFSGLAFSDTVGARVFSDAVSDPPPQPHSANTLAVAHARSKSDLLIDSPSIP
jgi:hypothetical protein